MKASILNKCFISLCAVAVILSPFTIPTSISAATVNKAKIVVEPGAKNVPDNLIQQLAKENPNAGVITILGYGNTSSVGIKTLDNSANYTADTSLNTVNRLGSVATVDSDVPALQSGGFVTYSYSDVKTTKTITARNQVAKDVFEFSVAKGKHVYIKKTYEASLTGGFEGKYFKKTDIKSEINLVAKYEKGTDYYGPDNSSKNNSTEYRIRFFQDVGKYTQTRYKRAVLNGSLISNELQTASGTYTIPTNYLSYSVERLVIP